MTVKERLITYLKYRKISPRQFTIAIGVSESYVSNIRTSIQPDKIDSITNHFPDLNTGWLLTGEGQMLKKEQEKIIEQENLSGSVTINREAFELILTLQRTIDRQQKTIEDQNREIMKLNNDLRNRLRGDANEDVEAVDVG
ncbi:MAG: hypothetical protein RR183_07110 [Bacteroidales bacterium]